MARLNPRALDCLGSQLLQLTIVLFGLAQQPIPKYRDFRKRGRRFARSDFVAVALGFVVYAAVTA